MFINVKNSNIANIVREVLKGKKVEEFPDKLCLEMLSGKAENKRKLQERL